MTPQRTTRDEKEPFGHSAAGAGEALDIVGELLVLRTRPSEEAPMLAFEMTVPPGSGPPLHTHAAEELFLISEGHLAFTGGEPGAERVAGPGDVVHVAGGRPHAYRNAGAEPARALAVFDDGLQMAAFFRALGTPVDPESWQPLPPPPIETIAATCREHGIELVGRPRS
jgi:quercetin dioxygenase-like cupin family protein